MKPPKNMALFCALIVWAATSSPASATIDFFWASLDGPEPPEVTAAFDRQGSGFALDRVTFDDLPAGVNVADTSFSVAEFQILPVSARGLTATSAFGSSPLSEPNLLSIDSISNQVTLGIVPVDPAASLSLGLLDLDVPVELTAVTIDGQSASRTFPGGIGAQSLWVGVVAQGNTLAALQVSPSQPDGFGVDDVEVRHLTPEPATGLLVLVLGVGWVSIHRRIGRSRR